MHAAAATIGLGNHDLKQYQASIMRLGAEWRQGASPQRGMAIDSNLERFELDSVKPAPSFPIFEEGTFRHVARFCFGINS